MYDLRAFECEKITQNILFSPQNPIKHFFSHLKKKIVSKCTI
jgi:hypothetical protein